MESTNAAFSKEPIERPESWDLASDSDGSISDTSSQSAPEQSGDPKRPRKTVRISRHPTLEKVIESTNDQEDKRTGCSDYFGVKSYLHYFYESGFKDPKVYEEDDSAYLLRPNNRRKWCRSVWWKVFSWIGVSLLVIGLVGILVGYVTPKKAHIIEKDGETAVIDKDAIYYNYNFDAVKLVGLVVFCIGGATIAISLLVPSFLKNYYDEGQDESFKVYLNNDDDRQVSSPLERLIPTSARWRSIQPDRQVGEAIVCQEGIVKVH
ncbi:LOW QUALITY PROTEIN: neurensin-1-like [Lingula anatina]|uniref:LOW QUALITY PROTEIN: neurensin-1-like n=1 Tax=Lingula anatina TaxID=7574 RepID=A0A1S3K458_LINAN|nr:LOW QUALITY PROTEIN: neurensin-1-like [Lingula anatina]|eukprot:XP_013417041.1 LOW QUALITY PROTEIN: neurensin-1-like [Lingula anatina]